MAENNDSQDNLEEFATVDTGVAQSCGAGEGKLIAWCSVCLGIVSAVYRFKSAVLADGCNRYQRHRYQFQLRG